MMLLCCSLSMKKLKDIVDSCRKKAEYYAGHEVAYEFDSIATQLESIIYPKSKQDVAKQIKKEIPSGKYKSWRGNPAIASIIGCNSYNILLGALNILKKEGLAYKVKADGTPSNKGPWWIIRKRRKNRFKKSS